MPARFSLDRIIRIVVAVLAVAVVVWAVTFFSDLALYLVLGAVVAYLIAPLVTRLQGEGLPRTLAVLGAFVIALGVVTLIALLFVPFFGAQMGSLTELLTPERFADVAANLDATVRGYVPSVPEGEVASRLAEGAEALFQREQITGAVSSALGLAGDVVIAAVIVPFVAFFLLKDGRMMMDRALRLVPNRFFEPTLALLAEVEKTIGRYFRALFLQMLSVGITATVLLGLVGLDGAVAVGTFTALANTIPYFGPPLGFAAGAIVGIAQTGDLSLLPGVAIAMVLTQAADNVLLQPLYFSRAANVHPLVILIIVLAGARVGGIAGMLVAIPLLTVLIVTVRRVLWSARSYKLLNPTLRPPPLVPATTHGAARGTGSAALVPPLPDA